MSALDFDPMEQSQETEIKPKSGSPVRLELAQAIEKRQLPYMRMIARMHDLFWDLPNITTKDVDARLQELFDLFMDAAGEVGISRMSVPQLKECCGKKRIWPGDPQEKTIEDLKKDIERATEEKLGWGLGDIIRRITRFFGFGHCKACEERRKTLNRIFRFGKKSS